MRILITLEILILITFEIFFIVSIKSGNYLFGLILSMICTVFNPYTRYLYFLILIHIKFCTLKSILG